jgi:hypothetical protein
MQLAKRIWHKVDSIGHLARSECVCLTVRLSDTLAPSDVVITRSTSDRAAELVLQGARDAGPFAPVPPEAACLLDHPFNPLPMAIDGR